VASATPATVTAACVTPTTFNYTGTITAKKAGPVTYRWIYSSGYQGPVETLTFTGPGTQPAVAGGVQDSVAGSGWAAIETVSPAEIISNKATYALTCSATAPALTLSAAAAVTPMSRAVGCASAPPTFRFSGTITANTATTVTYHWRLPGGNGPAETLTFTKGETLAVTSPTMTAASDTTSGSGAIVITSPQAITSNAAGFSVTCTVANVSLSVSTSPSSPDAVTCGTTPPTFTLSGVIESSQSLTATYHWVLPSGTTTGSSTVALTAGQGKTVTTAFKPGSDTFSGTATLQITSPASVSQSVPVDVTCSYPALSISPASSLPPGTSGDPYSTQVTASGGSGKGYSYSASFGGGLTGLSIDSSTGVISGTPQSHSGDPVTFSVVVMVTDGAGNTASFPLSLTIDQAP